MRGSQYRPQDLLWDAGNGDLYIADERNHAVRKLDGSTGELSTVAGALGISGTSGDNGPATSALLSSPADLALDTATGDLYIADTGNHAVRKAAIPGCPADPAEPPLRPTK